jgi:imidazoleglycerol phosphate synthase glutamine amidotransferase subunit HisH
MFADKRRRVVTFHERNVKVPSMGWSLLLVKESTADAGKIRDKQL